jgi:hypothetical protein
MNGESPTTAPLSTFVVTSGGFRWEGLAESYEDALGQASAQITASTRLGFAAQISIKNKRGSTRWIGSAWLRKREQR